MDTNEQRNARIQITKDGPYLVSGALPLDEQWIATNPDGESLDYREGKKYPPQQQYALCRCGRTGNRPFCDGTHKKVKFDGTETASREPYLNQAAISPLSNQSTINPFAGDQNVTSTD
jgi:CDGSH-type Zn-finger protein